ncbi:MAG TPA: radical SAM protein [Puia sp.]|nr:radical SAM protein [Puia sp.]
MERGPILFSHSYFLRFDPKQWETGLPYPPLGTLYAASFLRQHGFDVNVHDTMFAKQPDEVIPILDNIRPGIFVIYDDGFNYLTKMCLTNMREAAFEMCKLAKERGCVVIVSSSDASDHYEKYIQHGADFVITGEAELSLLELVTELFNGNGLFHSIKGLVYKKGNEIIKNGKRDVLKDLDSLPFPAWDLIDIEPYRSSWLAHAGYFSLNMATTRGCPFKCNWCAKPIYGNRYNSRSPQNVVQELIYLKEKFHFDHIWFCDDIFGLKPGWVQEFADIVQKENLKFSFKIQCRADLLLQVNYIKALSRAGCDNIWIGAESGSQKILDAMDKGITIDQIRIATKILKENGIKPSFFIQFGYPGEEKEDINKTIRMINELLPYDIGISVSYPLPGTVFFERTKAELKEKANWTDSDELQLMFKNTFSPAFYKQLHRYVHKTYRKHLAWQNIKTIIEHPSVTTITLIKKAATIFYYIPAAFLARRRLNALEKV